MKKAIIILSVMGIAFNLIILSFLPDKVPIHFDLQGQPDRFGSKLVFSLTYGGIYLFILALYFIIPSIDPKRRLSLSHKGYNRLIFSILIVFLLFNLLHFMAARSKDLKVDLLNVALGILFVLVGNYLPTMKPNYFVGIRTPWTLENERVWKKTHRLGGWVFTLGGIAIALSSLTSGKLRAWIITIVIAIVAIVPLLYSYLYWAKKVKPQQKDKTG